MAAVLGCSAGTKTVTVGDGSGGDESTATATAGALADAPKQPGEVVVQGDGRRNFGPYHFQEGVYTVKFEQFDPHDPNHDFSNPDAVPSFVVSLDRHPDVITAETKVV